jgi:hypothetical protein
MHLLHRLAASHAVAHSVEAAHYGLTHSVLFAVVAVAAGRAS